MKANNYPRLIGLPTCADGTAPTITSSYGGIVGVANMLTVAHYPKMCVGVIYETV